MDPIYLNNEQIDYELVIRGMPDMIREHHRVKSGRLREYFSKEHAGIFIAPGKGSSPYAPDVDLGICQSICAKIHDEVQKEGINRVELETLLTYAHHAAQRLRRIQTSESLQIDAKQLFTATAHELIQVIRERIEITPPTRTTRTQAESVGQRSGQQPICLETNAKVTQASQTRQASANQTITSNDNVRASEVNNNNQLLSFGNTAAQMQPTVTTQPQNVQNVPSNLSNNPFETEDLFSLRRSTAYWERNNQQPMPDQYRRSNGPPPNTNTQGPVRNSFPMYPPRNVPEMNEEELFISSHGNARREHAEAQNDTFGAMFGAMRDQVRPRTNVLTEPRIPWRTIRPTVTFPAFDIHEDPTLESRTTEGNQRAAMVVPSQGQNYSRPPVITTTATGVITNARANESIPNRDMMMRDANDWQMCRQPMPWLNNNYGLWDQPYGRNTLPHDTNVPCIQPREEYRTYLLNQHPEEEVPIANLNLGRGDHYIPPRMAEPYGWVIPPATNIGNQPHTDRQPTGHGRVQPQTASANNAGSTKPIPITSWKVYFTGETTLGKDEHSVNDFITLVNLHKTANNISDENMFRNIGLLLRKSALSWYIGDYRNIRTWSEFIVRFRQKYLSDNSNFEILSEIENRTQQRNEDAATYINDMINRFRSMPTALSEVHQCHIVQRNLNKANAMKLADKRYHSIVDLEKACRNIESMRKHLKLNTPFEERTDKFPKFKPRPHVAAIEHSDSCESEEEEHGFSIDDDFEGECDAISTRHQKGKPLKFSSNVNKPPVKEAIKKVKKETKCFNCRQTGHWFMECPAERTRMFCFRCGRDDITTPECPVCSPKNAPSGSPRTEEPRITKQE